MKKMNRKGFTIVELVIVIAVIAILAGVLIPTFSGIVTKANQSKSLQEVKNAYTETLADDLTENKAVVKDRAIVVAFTGYYVSITDKGAASVVEGSETATHKVESGKLVCLHTGVAVNSTCDCGHTVTE